jgi:hypothetical protein
MKKGGGGGGGRGGGEVSKQEFKGFPVLEKLSKEKGKALTGIALANVIHKAPLWFPNRMRKEDRSQGQHRSSNAESLG